MKIALFGGAFNPVHREHVGLALQAADMLKPDKLIIMPTAISPHKSGKLFAEPFHRYEMCVRSFADVPNAEVSDFEISCGGVSYTYLTCEHFAEVYPDAERYLIIGADMLKSFPEWRNPERILKYFTLAACMRENEDDFYSAKEKVEKLFSTKVKVIPYVGKEVSSTKVRTLAALGEDFSCDVPPEAERYIKENGLYVLKNLLPVKAMLKPKRWQHSVRVAEMCAENASRIGLEEERAITMAALHDCAKYLSLNDELLKGFTPPDGVPEPVMHQFTGAYVAANYFRISDELILDAIRYHTTGRENMTDAGMLLFLSDMLEEGRDFDGVGYLRDVFKKDMRLCLKESLSHQVKYLESCGNPIDALTYRAYEYAVSVKNK